MKTISKIFLALIASLSLSSCSLLDLFDIEIDFDDGGSSEVDYGALVDLEIREKKTDYLVGDKFVAPKVYAVYEADSFGKNPKLDVSSKVTCVGFDSNTVGTRSIDVIYTENDVTKTVGYDYTVSAPFGKTTLDYTYDDIYNNSYYAVDSCPSFGSAKLLVIPVWFTDSSNYVTSAKKDNVRSDIEKAYFGTTTETGWHSVKTYYETESFGNLSLEGTVSEWYSCGKASSHFYSNADRTTQLVNDAVNWYFSNNPTESRRNYDCNNDGYLDGVMCVYAAPNYISLNDYSASNLWAYAYWIQNTSNKNVSNPGPNVFFWASYDFMYGSNAYSRTGSNYAYGNTSYCTIDTHTFIHEMGHVFGLSDYYDYNNIACPAGAVTMQDYNVAGHDPYSVMALGWASPYIPTKTMDITIKPFQSSGDLILLTPSWNSYNSPFDEYLLIEYYTPTGLNKFDSDHSYGGFPSPSASGIRLWHVDARLITYNGSSLVMTDNPDASSGVNTAMSNTYWSNAADNSNVYCSELGEEYANFNLLQYIRNDTTEDYTPGSNTYISSSNMFKAGDSFNMTTFRKQFVNSTKLNNNKTLGWSFTVKSINSTEAVITVTLG
ncbi:MAG: hypothetical protein HUJ59_04735 [Bacilli bacterium]|nr:hypothetical protein [Bacilli bacterium]